MDFFKKQTSLHEHLYTGRSQFFFLKIIHNLTLDGGPGE